MDALILTYSATTDGYAIPDDWVAGGIRAFLDGVEVTDFTVTTSGAGDRVISHDGEGVEFCAIYEPDLSLTVKKVNQSLAGVLEDFAERLSGRLSLIEARLENALGGRHCEAGPRALVGSMQDCIAELKRAPIIPAVSATDPIIQALSQQIQSIAEQVAEMVASDPVVSTPVVTIFDITVCRRTSFDGWSDCVQYCEADWPDERVALPWDASDVSCWDNKDWRAPIWLKRTRAVNWSGYCPPEYQFRPGEILFPATYKSTRSATWSVA